METTIRNIGNSKGIIIPKMFVKKYHFEKIVTFVETKEGLVIKPAIEKSLFEKKLAYIKDNKNKIFDKMKKEAAEETTIHYYEQEINNYGETDLEILE